MPMPLAILSCAAVSQGVAGPPSAASPRPLCTKPSSQSRWCHSIGRERERHRAARYGACLCMDQLWTCALVCISFSVWEHRGTAS